MATEFVHLHCHTQFSMLDGSIRLKELVKEVGAKGMGAIAVTDHANMFGAVQLHNACKAAGVKPIIGCEVNLVGGDRADAQIREHHHLVLLAASQTGYENLVRIVSRGWVEGLVNGVPRVDFALLREHREGVVGMSACMGGYLAQQILRRGPAAGRSALAALRDSFDPGFFFVELQDHGFPEQGPLNEILVELAKDLDVPIVASNDCHYPTRDGARSQLVLQCIGAGRSLEEMQRLHHGSEEIYLKSPAEMAQRFSHLPEAISNTLRVSEMCAGVVNPLSDPKLPAFSVPSGLSEADYLRELSRKGLKERLSEMAARSIKVDREVYEARLEVELEVIISMGFPGYFLIVQDFIKWAKDSGVPVGPGRGSGAGSLVAYSLRITDLDPLPYGLLFERFLNPERVSMPDFDIDFCMDKRDRVIEYVREKYGRTSVGQIATFHLLKSRSVVRDVGRVMGFSPADAGRIATLVPEPVGGVSVPVKDALAQEPRLKAQYDDDPQIKNLLDTAMNLEDLTRHAGMHAAGVVISEGPLWDHVPVFCPEPDTYVTQYDKNDVESAGLVKFDFLGLRTLTVVDIATQLINKRPDREGNPFHIDAIPLTDAATFALLQSGETTNVFQLESSGMQTLFKQLRPDCFEDIVAAVALYRPGPLGTGMVEDFVQRKHGRVKVEYPHPSLASILEPTYGVIVYQEQVMQIAREMGGYSLGGADLLRRAMGKKKAEEMAKQKATFMDGAIALGHAKADADKVFELMAYFAGYGFNKCLAGDTEITDADTGARVTVKSLFERRRKVRVHALDDAMKLSPRPVTDVVQNGVKEVFELRTALGKRIVATKTHRFKTLDGYVPLGDLAVGDYVAAPRKLEVASDAHWPRHELITLAGLLSEGNTCHPSVLYFYGNDEALVGDFAQAASHFPNTVARIWQRPNEKRLEVSLSTGSMGARGNATYIVDGNVAEAWAAPAESRSGALAWAAELGILGKKATEKRIPPAIDCLADDDIALFVGRLWSGDGFVAGKTLKVPFYATSSRGLAEDVQRLLLRLGIVSRISEDFSVHVVGEDGAERFLERVAAHVVGRDPQLAVLRECVSQASDTLHAIAASDVFWDRIVTIEPKGRQQTYDLTVDVDHNFVANGLVVHNSHSAAYALITYQTAYLKAHYPVEFVAATLSADKDKTEKVVRTVAEARSMGITVLPPDVNVSAIDFTVVYEPDTTGKVKRPKKTPVAHRGKVKDPMGPRIRFGLGGVRGVGESALDAIFEERSGRATWERDGRAGEPKKEPFVDVFDLAARVDLRRVNKNVCIALVQCGGFDALHEPLGVTRAMASAAVESAIERGKKLAQERQSGQTNLFGLFGGGNDAATKAMSRGGTFPKVEPWDTRELLAKEKQTLGFYVSGHPLDRYAAELRRFCNATTDSLPEMDDRTEVTVGGSVEGYRERTTKTGRRIAFFDLEDPFGRVEVIVRPRVLADEGLRDVLQSGEPVIVTGSVQHEEERGASEDDKTEAKLILDGVSLLSVSLKKKTTSVLVRLVVDRVDRMRLEALKQCLLAHPGGCPVTLELTEGKKWTVAMPQTGLSVEPSDALLASLERLFGEKVCELR